MKYNFDEVIDRRNTNSLKYDFAAERGLPDGLLPFWVADMDFRTAPCVTEALLKSAEHAVYGYSDVKKDGAYFNAVRDWFAERFNFEIKPEWLVKTPGVVFALCAAVQAFSEPGGGVLIQPPVYYPFRQSIEANGRLTVTNPLVYQNGRYYIDFDDFERKIIANKVKLFILCNPHNPVGRVWTMDELVKMGEICAKYNVLVLSDEIHCDFIYNGHEHIVFGTINEQFLHNSLIFTSPSKSFNLAGLQISNTFVADAVKRRIFSRAVLKTGYSQHNTMGLVACQAAYEYGGGWMDELVRYLAQNYKYAENFIAANLPEIKLVPLEGTYLIWLDMSAYKLSEAELDRLIKDKAKLWVSNGMSFGEEGRGFIRINIACPRDTLKRAFNQLAQALI